MSNGQRVVIFLGMSAWIALSLVPPMTQVRMAEGGVTVNVISGHNFLFDVPTPAKQGDVLVYYKVDYERTMLFLGAVGVATLGFFALLKK